MDGDGKAFSLNDEIDSIEAWGYFDGVERTLSQRTVADVIAGDFFLLKSHKQDHPRSRRCTADCPVVLHGSTPSSRRASLSPPGNPRKNRGNRMLVGNVGDDGNVILAAGDALLR